MKIGVCAAPDKLALLAELKYDYLETGFARLAALDDEAFKNESAAVERYGLPVEAFNVFFTGNPPLYAKDGDQPPLLRDIADYAERGFRRAAAWGGKIAVIGSGDARKIPEGMSSGEIEPQFARVLSVCGEAAERVGMKVVVEPLSRRVCNYIHTVAEGAAAARAANHPSVGVMVDFYHHSENGDDLESLPSFADILWHAHYAREGDRGAPEPGDEKALARIADILRRCPNTERITLEFARRPDFDSAVTIARPLMDVFKENRT